VGGVTHVLHCAGATKALTPEGLLAVNEAGTRHVVDAVNAHPGGVARLVVLSSLAAAGPGTREQPRREDDPPEPVSQYGRSKLAGEQAVQTACRTEYVLLRPTGVYGPRDLEFLRLFKAARAGVTPLFGGGRQQLSLVFAPDLAEVAVRSLTSPLPPRPAVNIAAPEIVTSGELARAVAEVCGARSVTVPIPLSALSVICALASGWARLSGRATILAHGKDRELKAAGWVADLARLEAWLGPVCRTPLATGLAATFAWYRKAGWL
jgi:nucleoside-diphosphate-sugar epimerase